MPKRRPCTSRTCRPKRSIERQSNPWDIDECTNQEPPGLQVGHAGMPSLPAVFDFKGHHDTMSTASSGYFSANSQFSQQILAKDTQQFLQRDETMKVDQPKEVESSKTPVPFHHHHHHHQQKQQQQQHHVSSISKRRGVHFTDENTPSDTKRQRISAGSNSSPFSAFPHDMGLGLDDTLSAASGTATSSPIKSQPTESYFPESPRYEIPPIARCTSHPANATRDPGGTLDTGKQRTAIPILQSISSGVNLVSVDTVARLLEGKYANKNVHFLIVDCRYPYEYSGGHIKDAVNICTFSDLIREVFHRIPAIHPAAAVGREGATAFVDLGPQLDRLLARENPGIRLPIVREYVRSGYSSDEDDGDDSDESLIVEDPFEADLAKEEAEEMKNLEAIKQHLGEEPDDNPTSSDTSDEDVVDRDPSHVIIFHCEFSSQRAPGMAQFLRKLDRTTNCSRYPFLFYPETYVMKGGYAEFYRRFPVSFIIGVLSRPHFVAGA